MPMNITIRYGKCITVLFGIINVMKGIVDSYCPKMASVILYSVCAIIAITSAVSGEEGGTCRACNCQFNNVEVLNQLIESKIASGKLATIAIKLQWYQGCKCGVYMNVGRTYMYICAGYATCTIPIDKRACINIYCTASLGRQVST